MPTIRRLLGCITQRTAIAKILRHPRAAVRRAETGLGSRLALMVGAAGAYGEALVRLEEPATIGKLRPLGRFPSRDRGRNR